MQQIIGIMKSAMTPYLEGMPQEFQRLAQNAKADRQRQRAEHEQIVKQASAAASKIAPPRVSQQRATVTPAASQPRPVSRVDEQIRLHKELRQAVADRDAFRAEQKAKVDAAAVTYERNPSKIREGHEAESRRLAGLQREIEAEIRQATWNHC